MGATTGYLPAIFFYLFSAVTVGSAFMVIASRNPVHSVLFLILAFVNAWDEFLLALTMMNRVNMRTLSVGITLYQGEFAFPWPLISAALISLVQLELVKAWMVVIIIGREFAVSGLRSIAAHEGFSIHVSKLGKGKMVTQVAAVVGIILGNHYGGWVKVTAEGLMWAVVFLALLSMIQYFREFWAKLDSSIKYREKQRLKVSERRQRLAAERLELRRLRKQERLRKQQDDLEPTSTA